MRPSASRAGRSIGRAIARTSWAELREIDRVDHARMNVAENKRNVATNSAMVARVSGSDHVVDSAITSTR
jgi:hypothetical protein